MKQPNEDDDGRQSSCLFVDDGRQSSCLLVDDEALFHEPPPAIIDCVSHSGESSDLCENSSDGLLDRGIEESVDVNNVPALHHLSEPSPPRDGGVTNASVFDKSEIAVFDTLESKSSHCFLISLDATNGVVGDIQIPESSMIADPCPKLGFPEEKRPDSRKGEYGMSEAQEYQISDNVTEFLRVDETGCDDDDVKCPRRIQIIDGTALIETSKGFDIEGGAKNEQRLKSQVKSEQMKNSMAIEETLKPVSFNSDINSEKNDEGSNVYSRNEFEALRYEGLVAQKTKWIAIYSGLGPAFQEEYEELLHSHPPIKQKQEPQQQKKKKKNKKKNHTALNLNPEFQNHSSGEPANCEIEYVKSMGPAFSVLLPVVDESINLVEHEEYVEDEYSDDAYDSIQKPAFFIKGEPDFNSGPPEDGLEYLRRVRWEAAQIPNVKVVKFDSTKLNKIPTFYMPQIPDIPKCPSHLLPLKAWEDAFLADFSDLRLALSYHVGLLTDDSGIKQSNPTFESVDAVPSNTSDEASGNSPTLSAILRMNSVTRVSMLKKHISVAINADNLSRNDCMWLFTLCVAVDSPLDADSCASLRSLLRKCASLRAIKEELDEEVVMLNILATIAGKYFGQSEPGL